MRALEREMPQLVDDLLNELLERYDDIAKTSGAIREEDEDEKGRRIGQRAKKAGVAVETYCRIYGSLGALSDEDRGNPVLVRLHEEITRDFLLDAKSRSVRASRKRSRDRAPDVETLRRDARWWYLRRVVAMGPKEIAYQNEENDSLTREVVTKAITQIEKRHKVTWKTRGKAKGGKTPL